MKLNVLPFVISLSGMSIAVLANQGRLKRLNKRKRPRWWVRPIFRNRKLQGDYHNLINEMRLKDTEMFFSYTRMTAEQFDYLLSLVGGQLKKISRREPIEPGCRLAVTLRFLASGDSYGSLSFAFRISKTIIHRIVVETCQILWDTLHTLYLQPPSSIDWKCISEMFSQKWNLPNCCGNLDGKHVVIQCPPNSGSLYYNYKHSYSIVLLAVCDANYIFTYVDIGAYGSQSDGGIFKLSALGQALLKDTINFPTDAALPNQDIPFPYYFVGDEAFPLQNKLMRPFGGKNLDIPTRIYNYRISRARFCIENAFGILASRWRIFHRKIHALPKNVDHIIKATVCLHNYIKKWEDKLPDHNRKYCNNFFVDQDDGVNVRLGDCRQSVSHNAALQSITSTGKRLGARNAAKDAVSYRNQLKEYLNSPHGSVPWQRQRALDAHRKK